MRKQGKYETRKSPPAKQPVRKKSKNKLLLSFFTSIMGMVLCTSMLMGTTMAWFTDTVEITGNQINTGNLKVDILYNDVSMRSSAQSPLFGSGIIWKPEHMEVRNLTITNTGNLRLRYILNLILEADQGSIAKYFDVFVHADGHYTMDEGQEAAKAKILNHEDGWVEIDSLANIFTSGKSVLDGYLDVPSAEDVAVKKFAIAIRMRKESDDSTQNQSMALSIKLDAYQDDIPDDELGSAVTTTVDTADELTSALNRGGTTRLSGIVDGDKEILPWNGQFTGEYIWKTGGTLTGGTLKLDEGTQYAFVAEAGSEYTRSFNISDINFSGSGNQSTLYIGANGGKVTVSNVNVTVTGGAGIYVENSRGEGVELNGCAVYQSGLEEGYAAKFEAAVAVESSEVVINSGTYFSSGNAVHTFDDAEVTINGGTFTGGLQADAGIITINAGTFSVDPSNIDNVTVKGQVTANGDGTWTVTPSDGAEIPGESPDESTQESSDEST